MMSSIHGVNNISGLAELIKSTLQALHTYEQGLMAGERNPLSSTNSYMVTRKEANLTILSATTTITLGGGSAGDTHLLGIHIHTALTGTLVISGFADETGAPKSYTIPAGSVGYRDFEGAINVAGALTFTASNAADDDKIAIMWRPR